MRALIFICILPLCGLALAQTPAPVDTPDGRKNQKIERIHLEDSGATIDEIRHGGQTQSITVQPRTGVPAYEMQATDGARSRLADHREGLSSAAGQRVWNLFKF